MPVTVTKNTLRPTAPMVRPTEPLMREIGQLLLRRIDSRTAAGKDVQGSSFTPLSAGYAKRRGKAGLGTRSNLTLSGAMRNAMAIVAAGDTGGAFAWLEAAYRQRHPDLVRLNTDLFYATLRGDARFQDLLRRVGFERPVDSSRVH